MRAINWLNKLTKTQLIAHLKNIISIVLNRYCTAHDIMMITWY